MCFRPRPNSAAAHQVTRPRVTCRLIGWWSTRRLDPLESVCGGELVDDPPRDRQARGGSWRRRVPDMQDTFLLGEDEVVHQGSGSRQRLGADAGGAGENILRLQT